MKKRNQKRRLVALLCWMLLLTVISILAFAEETETPSCKHSDKVTREEAGKAATCTHDGNHTVITVCADCGQELSRQTVTDEAPGHRYKETARKDVACGKAGSVTYTCSRCGDHYDEEIPALKHDYQKEETAPTCTKAGTVTYTCSRCGDSYTETGKDALGHQYKETARKEASCGKAGSVTYTCSRCGDHYDEEIPALEHDYEKTETAPTCTEAGKVAYTCSLCGDTYTEAGKEALSHDYKETARTAASCGTEGSVTYTCSRCGDHYDEEIPALKHDYEKTEIAPTCTEAGKVTYTCSLCGDTYTEAGKEALGHDYKETARKEATYDAEGSVTYTCSRCKDSYQKTLPRLERPAVPFGQTETVDGVKITVSAEAGVFDADAKLNISKTGNSDFTGAAETALGVRAGERTVISHSVYSISGAKMNGSAQAELENLKLTDLRRTYPEGRVTVYVLRYDENAQKAADRAVRVFEEANPDGNSISFDLSELGLYDVMTVTRLPEKTGTSGGKSAEEAAGEPTGEPGEEPTEESTEEPAEELTENPTDESAEETAGEPTGEPGEEPAEELTENPAEESGEETAGEETGELGEGPSDEPTEEPGEESGEESTEETTEESAAESAEESAEELDGDAETETEAEPFAVMISASYEGELCYGSEVTLTAVLSVDDPEAVVVWEYSPDGGQTVFAVEDEHSSTLTYTYSEETRDYSWRVAVNRAPVD